MNFNVLRSIYLQLLERLDYFFEKRILDDHRTRHNVEVVKEELFQDLIIELWTCTTLATYDSYDPEKLIWLKARKVWSEFARRLQRESRYRHYRPAEKFAEVLADPHAFGPEQGSSLDQINRSLLLQAQDIRLLQLYASGHSYSDISRMAFFSTEAAAKMRFQRLKKVIITHFRRNDL